MTTVTLFMKNVPQFRNTVIINGFIRFFFSMDIILNFDEKRKPKILLNITQWIFLVQLFYLILDSIGFDWKINVHKISCGGRYSLPRRILIVLHMPYNIPYRQIDGVQTYSSFCTDCWWPYRHIVNLSRHTIYSLFLSTAVKRQIENAIDFLHLKWRRLETKITYNWNDRYKNLRYPTYDKTDTRT